MDLLATHSSVCTGVSGNCGMISVTRLGGTYISEQDAKAAYEKQVKNLTLPYLEIKDAGKNITVTYLLSKLTSANSNQIRQAYAFPVDWAFAEILEKLTYSHKPCIIFMSDCEDGGTDGHKGPFATRFFAHWLIDNEFMTGHCTEAKRNHYKVYAWNLVPNQRNIKMFIKETIKSIVGFIEEINNDPTIKKAKEAEEAKIRKQAKYIADSWGRWASEHPDLETANPAPQPVEPERQLGRRSTTIRPGDTTRYTARQARGLTGAQRAVFDHLGEDEVG